jgi:hypothetical protein
MSGRLGIVVGVEVGLNRGSDRGSVLRVPPRAGVQQGGSRCRGEQQCPADRERTEVSNFSEVMTLI